MSRLAGKVAIVTGAGTGIGRASAQILAQEGARVVIAERSPQTGAETAHEIERAGGRAIFIETDVSSPDSMEAMVRRGVAHFGRLDVLHNNAGGSTTRDGLVTEADLAEFWRVIGVDLFGMVLGCRFGIPQMIKAGGGSVINMTSAVAMIGTRDRHFYTAAKGGVASLTRALAIEYAPHKVRVNAIAPGVIVTERVVKMSGGDVSGFDLTKKHLLDTGVPRDIAETVLHLASDASRIVTGQILRVDGGATVT